jgi:hypothetical protein
MNKYGKSPVKNNIKNIHKMEIIWLENVLREPYLK